MGRAGRDPSDDARRDDPQNLNLLVRVPLVVGLFARGRHPKLAETCGSSLVQMIVIMAIAIEVGRRWSRVAAG